MKYSIFQDKKGNIYELTTEVEQLMTEAIIDDQKEIERLNKRIKELEEGFKASTEDLCEESTKIEKAIEYIEEYSDITAMFIPTNIRYETAKELLEILKGSK